MKSYYIKVICFLVSVLLIAGTFAGCAKNGNEDESYDGSNPMDSEESILSQNEDESDKLMSSQIEDSNDISEPESYNQIFTFKVNSDMPEYKCEVFISNEGRIIDGLTITNTQTSDLIQTLAVSDINNSVITESAAYFMDVTFDGNIDILVPCNVTRNLCIAAYLWDSESMQFVYYQKFEEMGNIAIDPDNKKILTHNDIWLDAGRIADFYSVFSFDGNDFILEKQVGFVPSEDLTTTVFSETEGEYGSQTTITEFELSYDYNTNLDKSDERLAPYYVSGSFWDLDGSKWESIINDKLY
ncbi:MAG: hypothetical protein PHW77_06110 [Eubacteriales bacterium]|nr:hypothetical protein [Eubacteriales bacterium]